MYIVVFYRYTSECKYTFQVIASVVLVLLLVTVHVALGKLSGTDQSTDRVSSIIGFIGIGVSIILYASPLETTKRIVSTKSASSIPILLCVVGTISNALWTADGMITDDLFVTIPNAVCLASGQGDLNKDQMDAITGHFSSTTSNTSAGDFEE